MKAISLSCLWLPVVLGFSFMAEPTPAQFVLSPIAVVATNITTYNETISATNLINQSGIETPFVSGVTVFNTYFADPFRMLANSGDGGTNNWQSEVAFDLGYQGYIDFDLGAVYQINKLAIWNRSLSNVTVKILMDLGGPEQVAGDFTLLNRQSYPFSYPAEEVLPFAVVHQGRYVRLVINSIYPIQGFSFGYASAGEVVASVSVGGTPPPTLSVAHEPNGDVKVTFTGTLLTSTTAGGTFTNVPGNPPSPYTPPKDSLLPTQFFRARSN